MKRIVCLLLAVVLAASLMGLPAAFAVEEDIADNGMDETEVEEYEEDSEDDEEESEEDEEESEEDEDNELADPEDGDRDGNEDGGSDGDGAEESTEEVEIMTASLDDGGADDGIALASAAATDDEHEGWTAITRSSFSSDVYSISQDGSYFLTEDVIGSIIINENVKATLYLNGKTITGNNASYSVITVNSGASLTLEDCVGGGTITRNVDKGSTSTSGIEYGAGIYVSSNASLTMTGGTISNCKVLGYGGGVYVDSGATFIMTGGTISNCTASLIGTGNLGNGGGVSVGTVNNTSASFVFEGGTITDCKAVYGGGVYVGNNSNFSMSGGSVSYCKVANNGYADGGGVYAFTAEFTMSGGSIYNNTADRNGGGVALESSSGSTFTMSGGEIYNNTAGNCGGGISVFSSSTATISAGKIYKNTANRVVNWAGGGIYVDSGCSLYLINVAIYNNTADFIGGGIGACNTANVKFYINDSGIIYGNTDTHDTSQYEGYYTKYEISTPSNEISLYNYATEDVSIASAFLGGGLYDWTDGEGTSIADISSWLETQNSAFLSIDNTQSDTEEAVQLAMSLATVLIYGNTASNGGGIGVNGSLTIGTSDNTTEVTVTKSWTDEGEDHPDSVTVWLTNTVNDVTYKIRSVELSNDNDWTHTFTDLPDSDNYSYYVEEENLVGYTYKVTDNSESGFIITNTKIKTSVTVTKAWDDSDDQDGVRPEEITVILLADGVETGETLTLSEDNNWTSSFTELDEYSNDVKIEYTVEEVSVDGYTSAVTGDMATGYVVTNTHETETVTVSGSKTWDDANDQDSKRPESVTIRLYADGAEVDSVTITAEDGWAYSFTDLPKYANGVEIKYTITEDAVSGYTATYDGYNVTNSYTPGLVSVTVTKAWDDGDNADGKRPESVTVTLVKNGEATDKTLTLSAENNWTASFTGLDEYTDGKVNTYTVREVETAGYTSAVTGDMATGYVITNSHTVATPAPTTSPKSPGTGDDAPLALYAAATLLVLAGLSAALLLLRRQKRAGRR